jgi:hypothetical protein
MVNKFFFLKKYNSQTNRSSFRPLLKWVGKKKKEKEEHWLKTLEVSKKTKNLIKLRKLENKTEKSNCKKSLVDRSII